MAVRTLLLQETRRKNLKPKPEKVGPGRTETEDEALIRQLLDQEVKVSPPTEEEVRSEWERDPARFRSPPLWEASHILCACDPSDKDARETSRLRAARLAEAVRDSPDFFARLAAEHSDCASAKSGGSLGQVTPGDTAPEFEAVLRGLGEGEVVPEPVLTRHGWHVIRLDAVAMGDALPYETARPKIAEAMEKAAWAREARDYIGRLIANAEIVGADIQET